MHYLVVIHSPYDEWHQPPRGKLFSTVESAEEYKAQLEKLQPESSVSFVSILSLQSH